MLAKKRVIIGAASWLLPSVFAFAEKVDMFPEELQKNATHIVIGTVQKIKSLTKEVGDFRVSNFTTEVRVDKVEKGTGVAKAEVIKIHYYRQSQFKGDPIPGDSGHRGLPAEGQTLRIYLARAPANDAPAAKVRSFGVLHANGFEKLKPQ